MGLLTNYVASNFRMPQTANQLVKYFWNRMLEYFSVNFFVGFWRDLPHSIKRKINFYLFLSDELCQLRSAECWLVSPHTGRAGLLIQ